MNTQAQTPINASDRACASDPLPDDVLSMQGVSFAYGSEPVLENINLQIQQGEFAAIVGPNGGGKTTLLKLILGLHTPSAGVIRVLGMPPAAALPYIGYTPQHAIYDQAFPVNALDVVLMGRLGHIRFGRYARADREAARAALDEMGVLDLRNRPFGALSGGQRQRVLIARALVSDPKLLLLDEPTANVDALAGGRILDHLQILNQRMTIIMVSHDLGFVSSAVDTVLCVNRTLAIHPTSELTGELIREVYHGNFRLIRHDHRCAEEGHSHD